MVVKKNHPRKREGGSGAAASFLHSQYLGKQSNDGQPNRPSEPESHSLFSALSGLKMGTSSFLPNIPAVIYRHTKGQFLGSASIPEECVEAFMQKSEGELIVPASGSPPEGSVLSRFLAKVAVEAMADRLIKMPTMLKQWIDDPQIDTIRNHARKGEPTNWPVHVRRIYDADARVVCGQSKPEQTVHEFDILQTEQLEYYFVLALFGVEMAINVGGPVIDGYLKWLQEHDGVSPLYYGKNDPNKIVSP